MQVWIQHCLHSVSSTTEMSTKMRSNVTASTTWNHCACLKILVTLKEMLFAQESSPYVISALVRYVDGVSELMQKK